MSRLFTVVKRYRFEEEELEAIAHWHRRNFGEPAKSKRALIETFLGSALENQFLAVSDTNSLEDVDDDS